MKFLIVVTFMIMSFSAVAEKSKIIREPSSAGSFVCGRLALELSEAQVAAKLNERCDPERYVQLITGIGSSASTPVSYCCVSK